MAPNRREQSPWGFFRTLGDTEKEKRKINIEVALKTCSEECKHVLLTFTIDFRQLGRLLRKWFPSLSSDAVPIIDSVGRCLIIFKPRSAMPARKLLAHRRTQLSSCLAEELQQGLERAVPEPDRAQPLEGQNLGTLGLGLTGSWETFPGRRAVQLPTPHTSWEPFFLFCD